MWTTHHQANAETCSPCYTTKDILSRFSWFWHHVCISTAFEGRNLTAVWHRLFSKERCTGSASKADGMRFGWSRCRSIWRQSPISSGGTWRPTWSRHGMDYTLITSDYTVHRHWGKRQAFCLLKPWANDGWLLISMWILLKLTQCDLQVSPEEAEDMKKKFMDCHRVLPFGKGAAWKQQNIYIRTYRLYKHDLNIRPGVYPDDLWSSCLPCKYKTSQIDEPTNTFCDRTILWLPKVLQWTLLSCRLIWSDWLIFKKSTTNLEPSPSFCCLWIAACITKEGWFRNSAWKIWRLHQLPKTLNENDLGCLKLLIVVYQCPMTCMPRVITGHNQGLHWGDDQERLEALKWRAKWWDVQPKCCQ